jgi:hypothetical protein
MLRLLMIIVLLAVACFAQVGTGTISKRGVIPFDATIDITNTGNPTDNIVRNATSHIYRDAQGRTRREDGGSVVISDPITGSRFILNVKDKTAQQVGVPSTQNQNSAVPTRTGAITKPETKSQDLGKTIIDGFDAVGQHTVTRIPPGWMGNIFWKEVDAEVWTSTSLGVPIITSVGDPKQGTTVERLRNIIIYSSLDASLFQVPADFKLISPPQNTNK